MARTSLRSQSLASIPHHKTGSSRCATAQLCNYLGGDFCLLTMCPAAKTKVRMLFATRLAPRILAKVTLWWLSSTAQRRRNNASAVQCVSQLSIPASANSLNQCVQHSSQYSNLCTATSCGPSVRVVGIFLLQEVIGTIDTAPVGKNNMIISQGTPCFCYCKVKLIQTFPCQPLHFTTWLACHSHHATACRRCHHRLQQLMLPQQNFHLLLYIGVECSD